MTKGIWIAIFMGVTACAAAQQEPAATVQELPPKTTLPIVFTKGVDADHAHVGDVVYARTTQPVALAGGGTLAAGAVISGHVIAAQPFVFDKAPYAVQKASTLAIRFDTVQAKAVSLPLNVYVRALAGPIASWDATEPGPGQDGTLTTMTQIGGDIASPSQREVVSPEGDVVGYNRRGGIYAHLIAAESVSGRCDASDTEEPMGVFSASACGLYGLPGIALQQTGTEGQASTAVLTSNRRAPKIWKNSMALLEVLPQARLTAAR